MKKVLLVLGLLVLVFALVACGGGNGQEAPPSDNTGDSNEQPPDDNTAPLIAGADISYPPFEYMESTTAVGFDVDLWKAIGEKIGREAKHENFAWDGLIPGLQTNKFDVIMSCMGITEDRLKEINFSIPYFYANFGLAVRNDSGIENLAGTKDKIVGVQTGTMAEKWTRDNQAELGIKEIVPYEVMNDGIMDLQAGRIDAVFNDKPYLGYTLKNETDIKLLPDSFGDNIQIGIGINKENTELKAQIDQAILDLVADGTYAQIYQEWFGVAPNEADLPKAE